MKSRKQRIINALSALIIIALVSCTGGKKGKLSIEFEKYQLPNGLTVVLHQDKSDPMVALAIQYHVGSNREVKGKTGFAHLFEHMMFQRSENVGEDQFDKIVLNVGGMNNGGTGNDGTVYFETAPKNALETLLWLESDRLGYLTNTVTERSFAIQQNVVQNEKRQRMDNQPYGFTDYLIDRTLYPDNHPYHWQVIGEMEDLQKATVQDVKDFHNKYYVPNNATIVVAGDFEPAQAKALIDKYFGEIPKGEVVQDLKPMNVTLESTKRLFHEDNFANTAQLTMVWPVVEQYTKEAYALDYLGQILSQGKKSPFYKVLVEEKKLTSEPAAYNGSQEITGKFYVSITANEGIGLTDVEKGVFESFAKFEKDGISDKDLEQLKAKIETSFYQGISSVLGKAFTLANYNEYAGDPSFIEKDLQNMLDVTKDDIMNVYNKYIKGKPYIITSFVPKGQVNLAAENSQPSGILEENLAQATEVKFADKAGADSIVKTPTKIDRSKEPTLGPDPEIILPNVWRSELSDGIKLYGIEQHELPLVQFSLVLDGGQRLDEMNKVGVANLITETMLCGTKNKTPEQLEEAIDLLGSNIYIRSGRESITISGSCLARNYQPTIDLIKEILLEPRWDSKEFEIAKTKVLNEIKQSKAEPTYVASLAFNKLLYGKDNIFSMPVSGDEASVASITLDDLKAYYDKAFSPSVTCFHVVGDVNQATVEQSLSNINKDWLAKEVKIPEFKTPPTIEKSAIYFVDMPGAKQSVINIGYLALPRNSSDYYSATVMNYQLGGGSTGRLFMILRQEKGFTYGAYSSFSGTKFAGPFKASASVRSNATEESVSIFKEIMTKYREGLNQADFDYTRNAILKSNACNFETFRSRINMLGTISAYGLPIDYVKQEEAVVRNMTPEGLKQLAEKYINPDKMIYLVVGDAATQMKQLKKIGFGDPILFKL